jgi:predicted protein tyrosine phosphatase
VPLRVLFVCSLNRWRSPTAERLFARDPRLAVRSAGTSPRARRRLTAGDLEWADVVVTMEREHRDRIRKEHGTSTPIEVLDVFDDFPFMDPELVAMLEADVPVVLAPYLAAAVDDSADPG